MSGGNPNHDPKTGRFTGKGGSAGVLKARTQHQQDAAIRRKVEKQFNKEQKSIHDYLAFRATIPKNKRT